MAAAVPALAAERPRLTIYTASQQEQVAEMAAAVSRLVPEAEIAWVRESAGLITERLIAERDRPRADMIVGLAASSLLRFKQQDLLAPYRPAGSEQLRSSFLDPTQPYAITGMDVYFPVICVNVERIRQEGGFKPLLWRDLVKPELKGRIVMADPTASGTGYNLVTGWLQSMGEAAGWAFMDALHENVAAYLPSGSAPCLDVARGEHAIGLGLDMRAAVERAKGAPIESIVPLDKVGWDLEAFAILRSTPHPGIARRIADWAASYEANQIYARSYAVVAHPDAAILPSVALSHAEARMAKASLPWMAENRDRILAEWTRRYRDRSASR